jgi:putative NADH-flavin reductase
MKSKEEVRQQLRHRILALPGVTERPDSEIHEDAFFVGRTMFMHIHGHGHCDIRLSKADQERILAEGKARQHRWAPEAGYVTSIVGDESDLEPVMNLIRLSHQHFFGDQNGTRTEAAASSDGRHHREPPMKLFVIGATGRTGQEIVQQALTHGHQVTAFVRSPEGMGLKNERLAILKGNVMDENQLREAMPNHDAVVSTLGPRKVFEQTTMLHDSALATIRAMKKAGVNRLVVLSAAAHFPGALNRIASFVMRNHMHDSLAMEAVVRESGLDWTIARPPRLTQNDSLTYRTREGAPPRMGFTITRKAVAAFMLNAIEQRKHVHKIVGITS